MERRLSTRKGYQQSVFLQSPRIGRIQALAYDVSLGGMQIENGDAALPLDASVIVVFGLPHNEPDESFSVEAVVVRSTPSTSGLMFVRMPNGVVRKLSTLLSQLPMPSGRG